MEAIRQMIQTLDLNPTDRERLLKELKTCQQAIDSAEFRYKRTLMDKEAITNILNASIEEIGRQKRIIEEAKNEINDNLLKLDKQKGLIEEKNKALHQALDDLKATQTQLIQAEKMASLGELTAGIAHEIQNPLNFVNNFSDLSIELLEELKSGPLATLPADQLAEASDLIQNLTDNLQKIFYHGRRAGGIVKNMLQHSRSGTGTRQLTDINSLTDEYLNLSFHGIRAKDKSFNAVIEKHFDPAVEPLMVVPEDLGRVLLNLFNNAFYAVNARKKANTAGYQPQVRTSTRICGHLVEIKVSDNGTGIPQKLLDKIYQPFFTTKPAGEGTGLGLSLSYDIITKGLGGELGVETKEGEGTSFFIRLPVNKP